MGYFDEIMSTLAKALSINSYKESVEKHEKLILELKNIKENTKCDLLNLIEIAQYDLADVIQFLYEIPSQSQDQIMRYIVIGVYQDFHENRIDSLEGGICCVDKASHVTEMTLKALKQQENLILNNYLSLNCVKDTDEAMQLFWDWYRLKNYCQDKH